jgi:hypothetical protein
MKEQRSMSTIAYSRLTSRRERSNRGSSLSEEPPGIRTWIDAVAALVPAEVLALHGLAVSLATETTGSTTVIVDPGFLAWSFWILLVLAVVLYVVPKVWKTSKWSAPDWARLLLPPLAFVAWTMLQRTTAFDAIWPTLGDTPRVFGAAVLAVLLVLFASLLAKMADETDP